MTKVIKGNSQVIHRLSTGLPIIRAGVIIQGSTTTKLLFQTFKTYTEKIFSRRLLAVDNFIKNDATFLFIRIYNKLTPVDNLFTTC